MECIEDMLIMNNQMNCLEEILSLNDKNVCKAKARELCDKYVTHDDGRGFKYKDKYAILRWKSTGGASSDLRCVFGSYNWSWNEYTERKLHYVRQKNGIEILNAQPNATGSTYSNKCRITIKDLKKVCKENGIKPIGDKKALLHALMKI
tara:strand:- start:6327 stop:6773 length:447 start_codon:yes stop_codon:yes gene_type:complete